VKFNGSCPPIELRQSYRASELCDCGGASNQSACNSNKGSNLVYCKGGNSNVLKTPKLTKLSISTDKCILDDLTLPSNTTARHDLNLTIVFTSNMIMNFFRSKRSIHHYTNNWVDALEREHNFSTVTVILDFEQHANLQIYGYDRVDQLSYPLHRNRSIIDEVLLKQNRLQIVGLNNFYLKHYEYSIQFDDFFYQSDDIINYDYNLRGSKKTRKSNRTKLYTNIEGFKYASSFRVQDTMIGVITVEHRLVKEDIFDSHDLIAWIYKETKCLQKLGAKIVLLLTDLGGMSAMKLLREIPIGIDLILSTHDDGVGNDYGLCNLNCDYNRIQDRIVIIKPTIQDITAVFIAIQAYNVSAPKRLYYTVTQMRNISMVESKKQLELLG